MLMQQFARVAVPSALLLATFAPAAEAFSLTPIGTYSSGIFDESAAEIPAYDPFTQQLFVVNAASGLVDVLSIADPTTPTFLFNIDITPYGAISNSVAFSTNAFGFTNGLLAVAVEAAVKQDPGMAVFFTADGTFQKAVTVGALPDMLTFTPDGSRVLVANEGEPNDAYTVDPEGSVSIVSLSDWGVTTAGFTQFNDQIDDLRAAGVRIFGPGATVAQDLEPEYITISEDGKTAWVALQENNAIGVLDIELGEFTAIIPLGFKDHSLPGNGFDASDRDDIINIANWPVLGMYQPDGIDSYTVNGKTYIVTANEGDARDYDGFSEESRLRGLGSEALDPDIFPNRGELRDNTNLGRLTISTASGLNPDTGFFEEIYAFGARSFSIWEWDEANQTLTQVFDSGDDFEQITAQRFPDFFNSNHRANTFETRSDDKGPEPEDVKVAFINGRYYAFIGLERMGGVMVYDITDPANATFVDYANNRNFNEPGQLPDGSSNPAAGDLGTEGLLFISATDSPTGVPLLVAANEVSGTTTIFRIDAPEEESQSVPEPAALLGLFAMGLVLWRNRSRQETAV